MKQGNLNLIAIIMIVAGLSGCNVIPECTNKDAVTGNSPGSYGNLSLWSTLDSAGTVTSPIVGQAGTASGGTYTPGQYSNAYKAGNGESYKVNFPKEVISANRGCIEFWAKLEGANNADTISDTIFLVYITYGTEKGYGIYLSANDGLGGSGLSGVAGYQGDYATGGTTYGAALGDATVWHHYAVCWDINDVGTSGKKVQIYLDGTVISSGYYRAPANLNAPTGSSLGLVYNTPAGVNVLIDNLKVYNTAKTDFSDRLFE